MEALRSISLIACFVGIAISMLDIMNYSQKLKKQITLVFSMVFLISILSPIVKGDVSFEIPTIEDIENSEEYLSVMETYNKNLAETFKAGIESNLKEKLAVNNIEVKEVSLDIEVDKENVISIANVNVTLPNKNKSNKDKAFKIVKNQIGDTPVEINFMEDSDEKSSTEMD